MKENEKEDWQEYRRFILNLPAPLQAEATEEAWSLIFIKLIENYLQTAANVRNDKRRGPQVRRTNLQRLLKPILLIQKGYSLRFTGKEKENPYRINDRFKKRSYFPFIAGDHINTKEEIDLPKLHYNREKYFIDPQSFCGDSFDTINARITLYDTPPEKFEEYCNSGDLTAVLKNKLGITAVGSDVPQVISVKEDRLTFHECYLHKLPTITQDTMRSNDLLDQLIVTYAIKQALNGDKQARNKLMEVYGLKAIKETNDFLKIRYEWRKPVHEISTNVDTQQILYLLLGGLCEPETLIKGFLSEREGRRIYLPLYVENFFLWYFSEYLPPYLDAVAQNPDSVDPLHVVTMMSPYSLIRSELRWKPLNNKHAKRFFSYCYRPQKDLNLTTWLFSPYGKFRLFLKDTIKELGRSKYIRLQKEWYPHGSAQAVLNPPLPQEAWLDWYALKNREINEFEALDIHFLTEALLKGADKKTPKKKILFTRNIQIYCQYKKDEYSQTDLAKMYTLSRRQIIRIIKQMEKEVGRIKK